MKTAKCLTCHNFEDRLRVSFGIADSFSAWRLNFKTISSTKTIYLELSKLLNVSWEAKLLLGAALG